ncbi:MAG TPA: protein-L-isoaspartate(D-aspartate) O-methyltransferase [Candidatus Sulfotelmatobacter sp.]|nr:protein-L-isoaspartate(D-aspartate) O-methyltransferase [Candidatus Sulfotelmatobacter sp.]
MTAPASPALYSALRHEMVSSQLRARGVTDDRVLAAMEKVPRHEFAPERYRDQAYADHPLPIGEGQTISQPYIVALMLEALKISPTERVLEIGTGSGYVTALLAELSGQVVSIERHASLADGARSVLASLGYSNLKVVTGDGTRGYPEGAPYDAIIVSAAASDVPPALLRQLAEGGRMIIPVGSDETQQLRLLRMKDGQPTIEPRELCRFVPLISENATLWS